MPVSNKLPIFQVTTMFDKLDTLVKRFEELNEQLVRPDLKVLQMQELNKERIQLEPIIENYHQYKSAKFELEDSKSLFEGDDAEMREMAKEEIGRLEKVIARLEWDIKLLLLPKDSNDQKNVILEIRAGAGGDEASLFAGELFQMYTHFAEDKRFKVELINTSEGTKGGYKEVIFGISGNEVFSWFKYEAGVHRVQRVPETETQGRVHTSACTVAVLPEAEEVDIKIKDKDLRIDVFRSGGPGGQSVNTTDSAVRITHIPTGLVVQCQDEKSQWKNKAKAMIVLRSRLYDAKQQELDKERAAERKQMVKSGDRSEKIRTYNFPQDRCTDHRVGLTVHNLPKLFSGEMGDLVIQLRAYFQAESLKTQAQS